jgi:hypothetical protein
LNPQDPLAALHPLREPGAIGWWPLAPGWWVLIALLLLLLCAIGYFIYRRYRANAYRRQAADQLQGLHNKWLASGDSQIFLGGMNALLKSVALEVFPRRDVASRSGADWVAFLNQTSAADEDKPIFADDFAAVAYSAEPPVRDCEALYRQAGQWIGHHRTRQ